jgi:hypothetical protein
MHQTRIDYVDALDAEAGEWLRVRISVVAGQVRHFTVQYETTLAGTRIPVVRYDTAHGVPHRDLLNRHGEEVAKDFMMDYRNLADALVRAERDVRQNWPRYLDAFLKEER